MELQLSLGLPIHTPRANGFDLNRNVEFEPQDFLSSFGCSKEINAGDYGCNRGFGPMETDHGSAPMEMFPLVSWNGDQNEEDGSDEEGMNGNSDSSNGEYGETNFMEGWPPIDSWRKKMFHDHQGGGPIMDDRRAERGGDHRRTNSVFVKVKMEGVPIGRKIDLNLYHSYEMLTTTLINMFAKYLQEDENDGAGYTLLYQDKQGNWVLAGEVPWQSFIESVRRMEVIRNDRARSS